MAGAESNQFDLFVTCVDKVGPMLKIWGQVDRLSSMFVEQLLKTTSIQFEAESGLLHLSKLSVGLLCCAKYKDGHYYRAQITNLRQLVSGSVEVKFVDYGNVEVITVENIRLLENVPLGLTTMKPQAVDFVLANVIHVNQKWDDMALTFIHSEIAYMELKSSILGAVNNYRFIKIMFHDTDLSEYLIQRGIATPISLVAQENMVKIPKITPIMVQQFSSVPTARTGGYQSHVQQPPMSPMASTPELCSYKTLPLEPNSEHMVYISYVEDGPYLFSIQLQAMEEALEKLMIEINQINNLLPLSESPLPGYPCMARCLEDSSLCRAVVINLVEDKCKTYYVDFGNTDILPFSNIFQIPFKYMLPKVMSMRFTLAGLKNIKVTNEMKCAFKEFVTNKLLKLKVLKLDSSPVLQYCELYDEENTNIINILFDQVDVYKSLQLNKGMKYDVIVSFIEGCKKFFVQLKEYSDSLNKLMLDLANTCEGSPVLQNPEIGKSCVAYYSGDNQWYRAQILSVANDKVTVKYVDYGNEDTVSLSCLKQINTKFVKQLPSQAIECCLYGYQNMSFNNEIESVFESLTLECEFSMKVISKQNNDTTLLVDLFDASGNNVAALLIEKLASQKSQLSPLPAHMITRSLLNNEENMNPNAENHYAEIKSPTSNADKLSWRNSTNDKSWKSSGNEKKNFRNASEEKQSWRNSEDSPPKNRAQSDNWNGDSPTNKRSQRNESSFSRNSNSNQPREGGKFSKRSPHNHNDSGKGNSWNNSGSGSEKSWSGTSVGSRGKNNKKEFKQGRRNNDFPKRNDFGRNDFSKSNEKRKLPVELPPQELAPLTEPFNYMEIAPESSESVSISWFYNPENFFCQLLQNEAVFRDMMNDIQSAYNGRPSLNTNTDIPIGASIIAEFHEDSILYRATVLENKYPKYKVQYVDFGNMSLVDNNKIWQVEKKFMNLPMQAIKCSLSNIKSSETNWPVSDVIDNLFNRDSFSCAFVGCDAEKYFIQLFDNDSDVRQKLIDSGIAIDPTTTCQMLDDPIDLQTLIGQNIRITVSFIQGLNKFYVHLQQDKAALAQESINTFMKSTDITTLPQFAQDQIAINTACLVQVDNEIWKRAVVTDNSDLSSIQVDYPDFGGCGTYSSEKIFVLPQQLCVYWYQGFECSLHNLSDEINQLVSDEDFKNDYEGQELVIYVDEIVNGRLIVTLYETSGKKLELIEPDEGAYPTIEPLCSMPILNATLSVYVSHVNNVNSLYLQRESDGNKIAALLESLFEFYEAKGEVADFKQGDLCCAKSENDGNWYRGRLEELNDETTKVLYIDYGNTEHLPKDNLRVLDQSFFTHELAIHVGLNLQEISPELTNKIIELTTEKLFTANIIYGDSGWIVDLTDSETNLNQALIDLNLASALEETFPVQQTIVEETESELVTSEPIVTDNSRAQITITHIDSPSEFYVQLVTNEESIDSLQADLQEKVKDLPDLEGADIGVLCAAKYTVDEQWYRAEVLDADAEITTVRFVDYGNTDVITNNQGSIKTLPADLLSIDKYARKCSLNVMPNKGEEWPQEASEIFENAVNSDVIHADIVYQDEKNKTYVDLFVNGNNVAEELLTASLAVSITRDAEDNIANNTGFVSHVNSVSEFWIQLESSVPDLEMIVDRLANAETFSDLQDLSPGILCAANFPDDEMWYRARILSNTVAGIEVLFVDYGNSSTAMKLKVLPEDLIQMPILGQKCSLNKPSNITTWSEQANEKFREISEDGATIFTIRKLTAGETSVVELFMNGNNILDQLVDLCEEKSASEQITPVGEQNVKVQITHIEAPSYFWMQQTSDSEKIEEMTETLASAGSFKKLIDWNVDTTCAALYADSGLWYRAKILEFTEDYEVLLVDYGNIINTGELRTLPEDVAAIPPLANLCSLQLPNDIPDWTEDMCSKFTSLIDNCNECRIEFIDTEVPSTVRLFIDGKNIVEEMCADTPQTALASASSVSLISDEISLLAVNTHLPEPLTEADEEIAEIPEIEPPKAEVSMMDESYLTAMDENEESSLLDDSNETVKEASFIEAESVASTDTNTNQDNKNLITEVLTSENNPDQTNEQEKLVQSKIETECAKSITSINPEKTNVQENIVELEIDASSTNPDAVFEQENLVESKIETECVKPITSINPEKTNVQENIVELEIDTSSTNPDAVYEQENLVESEVKSECFKSITFNNLEETKAQENLVEPEIDTEYINPITASTNPDEITSLDNHDETNKQDNLEESEIESECINPIISSKNPDETNVVVTKIETEFVKPITSSNDDRIVPGSMCGTENEIPAEIVTEENVNNFLQEDESIQETETTLAISRPTTPHCDKIVPGSICRGDLEEPSDTDEIQNVTEVEEEVVQIPSRPVTPHSEKIVPGSICRGSMEQIPPDYEVDNVHFPVTSKSEKIVPGAICRGDLEEPPVNCENEDTERDAKSETIPETVILEDIRPKTPIEEKIVPGSINKGMDLKEDISS